MPVYKDIKGQRFGRLVAVRAIYRRYGGRGRWIWECRCDCGNYVNMTIDSLSDKHERSCGCKRASLGGLVSQFRREYCVWWQIRSRCNNPLNRNYHKYGGRGIRMAPEWSDGEDGFRAFVEYTGKRPSLRHSLDRIDNNGNYEPGNVRWATPDVQANNRRGSLRFTFRGQTRTITEWAEHFQMKRSILAHRLANGWPLYKAATWPYRERNRPSVMFRGKRIRLIAWAKAHNFAMGTLNHRLNSGWSVERILKELPHKRPVYTKDQLVRLRQRHDSWSAVARTLGISPSAMRSRRKHVGLS